MDLTWDNTSDNWYGDLDQRHLYFGLTDELMAIAHSDHTANYQKDDYVYRSTDLSNNYFVRNGKADEWVEKYADHIGIPCVKYKLSTSVKERAWPISLEPGPV